jgi:hypothetical protein
MGTATISTGAENGRGRGAIIIAEGQVCFLQAFEDGLSNDGTEFTNYLACSMDMHFKVSKGIDQSDIAWKA